MKHWKKFLTLQAVMYAAGVVCACGQTGYSLSTVIFLALWLPNCTYIIREAYHGRLTGYSYQLAARYPLMAQWVAESPNDRLWLVSHVMSMPGVESPRYRAANNLMTRLHDLEHCAVQNLPLLMGDIDQHDPIGQRYYESFLAWRLSRLV